MSATLSAAYHGISMADPHAKPPHWFVRAILFIPHRLVAFAFWPLVWGGLILSFWLASRCVQYVWHELFHLREESFQAHVSGVLHAIELLLLTPLPGIAGAVAYHTLRIYLDPEATNRGLAEQQMDLAKRLTLGILVSVAGTRMLIAFLEGNSDLHMYGSGALLIAAITLYSLALRE